MVEESQRFAGGEQELEGLGLGAGDVLQEASDIVGASSQGDACCERG